MILSIATLALLVFLYRQIIYCRIDPLLSIIIIKNNNGYSLFTYSNISRQFNLETFSSLEHLWTHLVTEYRVYHIIDQVDSFKVVDRLMNGLHLYPVEKMFHYHVYWENEKLVRYMLRKNILLQFVTYPDFHILVADQKWLCFDLVTSLMSEEFDTIFDKLHPDQYHCVLELGRRLRLKLPSLCLTPKIKQYLDDHNKNTMKQLEPFMNNQVLPLDVNKLVASYLLY